MRIATMPTNKKNTLTNGAITGGNKRKTSKK